LGDQRVEAAVLILAELGRGSAGELQRVACSLRGSFRPGLGTAAAEGAGADQNTGTDKRQNQEGD
jgi:hypothetical protein